MIVLKGDTVKVASGVKGEVLDVWGIARTFFRLMPDSGGKPHIYFETDVIEILHRNQGMKRGRR